MTIPSKLQEGVSVCTGRRKRERGREAKRHREGETERAGRGSRETHSDIPSQTFSLQRPHPSGPIHAAMSSRSNLGLTVDSAVGFQLPEGRLPGLAWQGRSHCSHRGRHPGTLHSQDEPREQQAGVEAGTLPQGLRGSQSPGKPPKNHAQPVDLALLIWVMGARLPARACFLAQLGWSRVCGASLCAFLQA